LNQIPTLNPSRSFQIFEVSCKTGFNIDRAIKWLSQKIAYQVPHQKINLAAIYLYLPSGIPIVSQIFSGTQNIDKDMIPPYLNAIDSFLSGWYAGNIILWPVAVIGGLIVDPLTGAMWSLTPKEIDAILETSKQFEELKLKEQKGEEKESKD